MVFRATVLALLGSLLVLHIGSELRTTQMIAWSAAQAKQSSAAPAVIVHRDAPPARLPADTMVVDLRRSELDAMVAHANPEVRIVRTTRAGDITGLRLEHLTPGSLLATLGFESGDTVLAMNDQPVADLDHAALIRTIGDAPFSDIQFHRHGQMRRTVVLVHP